MEYDNTNRGAMFKNKSENPKAPAYTGTINVDGKEYRLSAWVQASKKNADFKFFSLAVEPAKPPAATTETQSTQPVSDDDMPF